MLHARRAAQMETLAGRFDGAGADYAGAEQLGLTGFTRGLVSATDRDCQASERWSTALWFLERLLAARPKDWTVYADRAAVYGQAETNPTARDGRAAGCGVRGRRCVPGIRRQMSAAEGRWDEAVIFIRGPNAKDHSPCPPGWMRLGYISGPETKPAIDSCAKPSRVSRPVCRQARALFTDSPGSAGFRAGRTGRLPSTSHPRERRAEPATTPGPSRFALPIQRSAPFPPGLWTRCSTERVVPGSASTA